MSDTRISQLPSPPSALSGAEIIPIVQNGVTYAVPLQLIVNLTNNNSVNITYTGLLTGGSGISYTDTGILAALGSSPNSYVQAIIQNKNNGAVASANYNVSNDQATATTNFAEFGINSSGFTGSGAFNQPGYGYLASASTDLAIGTYGANSIHFVVNSGATDAMTINGTTGAVNVSGAFSAGAINNTPIGSTTPSTGAFTTLSATSFSTAAINNTPIGSTTPSTGAFTTLSTSNINSGYLYGNRVISGAMEIDQANSGAAVTPTTNAYLTDMFGAFLSQASKLTFQQVADAPAGLKNSMKITVASQYSPAATDYFQFVTAIEGKDVIDFQLGTSGAATFTTSHWIKGSVAGTYSVSVGNSASSRFYVGTISVTTSWAQVKITLTGDVTGTWATDNTVGLFIKWDLGSGSNYNGTAGTWQAGNPSRTSGSVTFVNQTAGSTLNITGVDCRLGSVAPTYFERRANELELAKRYFRGNQSYHSGSTSTSQDDSWVISPSMRAAPTVTWTDSVGNALKLTTNLGNNIALNAGGISATSDVLTIQANTVASYVWYQFIANIAARLF